MLIGWFGGNLEWQQEEKPDNSQEGSRLADRTLKLGMVQESQDLRQNGLAWLSGLIPEQGHRDRFVFIKTEPWTVNGTALAMLRDFNFSA